MVSTLAGFAKGIHCTVSHEDMCDKSNKFNAIYGAEISGMRLIDQLKVAKKIGSFRQIFQK